MYETMITMYRKEGGFLALYRGIIPTVAGVAPYVSALSSMPTCLGVRSVLTANDIGRAQFHDIRICAEILDAGR